MKQLPFVIKYLLIALGPLLFGVLLIVPPLAEPVFLMSWSKQALTFIANFLIFSLLIQQALKLAPSLADLSKKNWFKIAVIVGLLLVNLITLEAFRRYFPEVAFAATLGIFTVRAIADLLWTGVKIGKPHPQRALLVEYLYWCAVTGLGSYCFLGSLNPLLVVMACALGGVTTSSMLLMRSPTTGTESSGLLQRSFAILAFSGPVLLSLLVYGREIGPAYLLTFLPALLVFKLPIAAFEDQIIRSRWQWRAAFNSALFAAILLALNYT